MGRAGGARGARPTRPPSPDRRVAEGERGRHGGTRRRRGRGPPTTPHDRPVVGAAWEGEAGARAGHATPTERPTSRPAGRPARCPRHAADPHRARARGTGRGAAATQGGKRATAGGRRGVPRSAAGATRPRGAAPRRDSASARAAPPTPPAGGRVGVGRWAGEGAGRPQGPHAARGSPRRRRGGPTASPHGVSSFSSPGSRGRREARPRGRARACTWGDEGPKGTGPREGTPSRAPRGGHTPGAIDRQATLRQA